MAIFGGFAFYFAKKEERNQMGANKDAYASVAGSIPR